MLPSLISAANTASASRIRQPPAPQKAMAIRRFVTVGLRAHGIATTAQQGTKSICLDRYASVFQPGILPAVDSDFPECFPLRFGWRGNIWFAGEKL